MKLKLKHLLLVSSLLTSVASFSQAGQIFPMLEGENLEREPILLPDDLAGKYTILGLAFSKKSENIRYLIFNKDILNAKYMINLIDHIRENVHFYCNNLRLQKPPRMWLQLWCNFLLDDEKIEIHQHSFDKFSFLSGNLCLKTKDTSTHYLNPQRYFNKQNEIYNSKNEMGKLTIFPSTLPHTTDKVSGDEKRVTIAFDVIVEGDNKLFMHNRKHRLFENNVIEL